MTLKSVENNPPPTNTILVCRGKHGAIFLARLVDGVWLRFPSTHKRRAVEWSELPEDGWIPATTKPEKFKMVLLEGIKGGKRIGFYDGFCYKTQEGVFVNAKQWHEV